uniref:Plastid lipid-associated protein/fibrillin conserved domain-containing protein n=1 Tax=Erythrolobus australicus TaxID=1077150 RepID=A0A7S1TNQ2_9RHOD
MAFVTAAGCGGAVGHARGGATSAAVAAARGRRQSDAARCRRAAVRMQAQNGGDDSMPSDTPVLSNAAEQMNVDDKHSRSKLVQKVLRLAACTNRGRLASAAQGSAMEELVLQLESVNPNTHPMETDTINGTWKLVYFMKPAGAGGPFEAFLKVQKLVEFGEITQMIDLDRSVLTQEAQLFSFPGVSSTVTTTARVTPVGPERMEVVLESTAVKGNALLEKLDLSAIDLSLPIGDLYERVRGAVPETYFDTYYLDDELRVSRDKRGNLYVFIKE